MSSEIKVGDAVTWNQLGIELFGATEADGVVLSITDDTAHILWSTDQETWATVSTLVRVSQTRDDDAHGGDEC